MSGAPDLAMPVAGFRAWWPERDGRLRPVTMSAEVWEPGVNEARCLLRSSRPHTAPGHRCTCGIYALASPHDPRLECDRFAVGSVAAWGEMEVHSTGFRARYACITALCFDESASTAHLTWLRAAAARYRVPLVHRRALRAMALEHAAALDFRALAPGAEARRRGGAPSLEADGATGIAVEDHLWVRVESGGLLLGITSALARELAPGALLEAACEPTTVRAGATLATLGEGERRILVRAPVDLSVEALNPAVFTDPDLPTRDPEGRGWLLRVRPPLARWARQGTDIAWGRAGETHYRASLAEQREAGLDPFRWLRPSWVQRMPQVRSGADVLAVLAAERERPRFAGEREVREHIGGGVARALGDPRIRRLAFRAQARVHMRLHDPEADVDLDLFDPSAGPPEELTIYTDADTADRLLAGRLDAAQALRARRIQSPAPAGRVLGLMSLLEELQRAYARDPRCGPRGPGRRA